MKAKLETSREFCLDENSVFKIKLVYKQYWDYKFNKSFIGKSLNIFTIAEIQFKLDFDCACIDSSIVNCARRPIVFVFVLDKLRSFEIFVNQKLYIEKKTVNSQLKNLIILYQMKRMVSWIFRQNWNFKKNNKNIQQKWAINIET